MVLVSSAEGRGIDRRPGQTKDMKTIFAVSPLSTRHLGVKAKTGRLRVHVRIMGLGKVTCFPADCCFRELAR